MKKTKNFIMSVLMAFMVLFMGVNTVSTTKNAIKPQAAPEDWELIVSDMMEYFIGNYPVCFVFDRHYEDVDIEDFKTQLATQLQLDVNDLGANGYHIVRQTNDYEYVEYYHAGHQNNRFDGIRCVEDLCQAFNFNYDEILFFGISWWKTNDSFYEISESIVRHSNTYIYFKYFSDDPAIDYGLPAKVDRETYLESIN